MRDGVKSTGAFVLVAGGLAGAFSLAACCALPILVVALGLGAGWLAPIALAAQPHAGLLTALSAAALLGSVAIVLRAPKSCRPESICARPAFRGSVIAAAGAGAVLLVLSRIYA